MKTVLSVIQTPTYGGPHNRVTRMAPHLEAKGWKTVVCLPTECESGHDRMVSNGLEVHQVPIHRMRKSWNPMLHLRFFTRFRQTVRELRELIRRNDVDVVQICGLMGVHGGIAAHAENVPVVWQILGTFAPMPLRRILVPKVLRCSDAVMVTGKKTADLHPGLAAAGERISYFYPPVDLKEFHPDEERRRKLRAELGIGDDEVLVGTVGNRNRAKSHEIFVAMAEKVAAEVPSARFLVCGDLSPANAAAYEAQVMEPARRSGLLDKELLHFEAPEGRVADFLCAFDIFVLTSDSEGVPTAMLEAMSTGLPVVSTNVGSIGEIITEGENGFTAEPRDAAMLAVHVTALARSAELREKLGGNALRKAEAEFDIRNCVRKHTEAYESAIQHRGARATG